MATSSAVTELVLSVSSVTSEPVQVAFVTWLVDALAGDNRVVQPGRRYAGLRRSRRLLPLAPSREM